MLAIRKLGQLTKPTINLTKRRERSVKARTNKVLGINPIMSKITRATYSMSTTN